MLPLPGASSLDALRHARTMGNAMPLIYRALGSAHPTLARAMKAPQLLPNSTCETGSPLITAIAAGAANPGIARHPVASNESRKLFLIFTVHQFNLHRVNSKVRDRHRYVVER